MDVRQLDSRMPVYFLCRLRKDYWSEYSLIVEDLYRSPGYPLTDERRRYIEKYNTRIVTSPVPSIGAFLFR